MKGMLKPIKHFRVKLYIKITIFSCLCTDIDKGIEFLSELNIH
jgi:hypothetical protein